MLNNEELIKKMGDMGEEDIKSIEAMIRVLEGVTKSKQMSLTTLESLENIERELSIFRSKYTWRLLRLMKLNFKLTDG
jgi:hypothetical protein